MLRHMLVILCVLLPLACASGDDSGDEQGGPPTDSSAGDTAAADSSGSSTGAPLPDPGVQGDPCACDGADPNLCTDAQSNCDAPLSCVAGECRTACTGLDDTSCPPGSACIGIEIDDDGEQFWCA
jgi:hypothetical protein